MFKPKSHEESKQYDYLVCEVKRCPGIAKKIFISNNQYMEVCIYHYDEMFMV